LDQAILAILTIRIIYCLLFLPTIIWAQDSPYIETDITQHWEVFDPQTKSQKKINPSDQVTSLKLNLERQDFIGSHLIITTPDHPMILLNGKVIGIIQDTLEIDLSELLKIHSFNNLEFSMYSKSNIRVHLLSTTLVQYKPSPDSENDEARILSSFMDNFIILVLIILVFFTFLINKFPKDSSDYARIANSFSVLNRDDTYLTFRPLGRNNILFVVFNSLLFGFLFVTLNYLSPWHFRIPFFFSSILLNWLLISITIFFLVILKYFLISGFSRLFALEDFKYIQFFNSIRISIGVSFFCFLSIAIIYLTSRNPSLIIYSYIINAVIILLIMKSLVLFFKLLNYSNYKTFHLIAYLCATEIIPFLVSYKIVMG